MCRGPISRGRRRTSQLRYSLEVAPDVKRKFVSIPVALTTALLAGTLLSGAVSAAPKAPKALDSSVRIHPKLQYGAQVEPNKKVRVLVQKKSSSNDTRAIASRGHAAVKE